MFIRLLLTNRTWKTGLARRLAPILDGVRHFMAENLSRPAPAALAWKTRAQISDILSLAWNRVGFLLRRIDNLAARVQAGPLPPPRIRPAAERLPHPTAPRPRLPAANLWIYRLAQTTAGHINHVRIALDTDPDIHALIAAAPQQAGRLIRPLCRMLGIDIPAALRLPRRARKPRPPKPPRAAKPTHPPTPDHYKFSQVPKKWQFKVPGLNARRPKNWKA